MSEEAAARLSADRATGIAVRRLLPELLAAVMLATRLLLLLLLLLLPAAQQSARYSFVVSRENVLKPCLGSGSGK